MTADDAIPHQTDVLVAGGGLAGLAAAIALRQARPDLALELIERTDAFAEVGAGIQLGPNAVRVLHDWGLQASLASIASYPLAVVARSARSGRELGCLPLGERAISRYGAPYVTVHRADLHALLLAEARRLGVDAHVGQTLAGVQTHEAAIQATSARGLEWQAQALLGCDGLWSQTRQAIWNGPAALFSGHIAYRGMVRMAALPTDLRQSDVVVWLGSRMHAVQYPVRGGEWLNLVVVVHGALPTDTPGWDHSADADTLRKAMGPGLARNLQRVLEAVAQWRCWPLYGRPSVRRPADLARGPVALLGDAGHPMRPYLAQGAAMAIEDAWTLGRLLSATPNPSPDWPALLQAWARARCKRCGWVQSRSVRNGYIFHASGPVRWARDAGMRLMGARLMDVPTLYQGPPNPL